MSRDPTGYLRHVLDEADYLIEKSAGLGRDAFLADETLKRAFVRSLEIIGEAVKNLPESFRSQHPEIPWRLMAGMRDRLIHGYFGVDFELVWDVIESKIPDLRASIARLVESADFGDEP